MDWQCCRVNECSASTTCNCSALQARISRWFTALINAVLSSNDKDVVNKRMWVRCSIRSGSKLLVLNASLLSSNEDNVVDDDDGCRDVMVRTVSLKSYLIDESWYRYSMLLTRSLFLSRSTFCLMAMWTGCASIVVVLFDSVLGFVCIVLVIIVPHDDEWWKSMLGLWWHEGRGEKSGWWWGWMVIIGGLCCLVAKRRRQWYPPLFALLCSILCIFD